MIRSGAYAAHEAFVAPARQHSAVWRLIVGLILAFAIYAGAVSVFFQLISDFRVWGSPDSYDWGTAAQMYVTLFSFGFMALATGVSARLLHRRGFFTLLGSPSHLVRDFRLTFLAVVAVSVVIVVLPPWPPAGTYVQAKPLSTWLLLLVPSLCLILLQVSAEEIVFRGYVQQQLAARFKSPMIWMVLPSVLFATGHYVPGSAGSNALAIAIWSGVFGILMADLTARAGSLGPAIAVHFWNNIVAMMLISPPDEMYGLTLYYNPTSLADEAAVRAVMPVEFGMTLVLWLAARVALRR
ncbi:MAG: type II CAAX endopeptidase family protein [Pseudomonadota bacterium]